MAPASQPRLSNTCNNLKEGMIYCARGPVGVVQSTITGQSVVFTPVARQPAAGNVGDVEECCSPQGSWEAKRERKNLGSPCTK